MNDPIDYMLQKIFECERHCDICRYKYDGCSGGIHGGPDGPIYPPCSDMDFGSWAYEDLIEEVYKEILEEEMMMIEKVRFYNPTTVVWWEDGTKTVVRAEGEAFDKEKGLAMAIAKKYFGNTGSYWNEFKKWTKDDENA